MQIVGVSYSNDSAKEIFPYHLLPKDYKSTMTDQYKHKNPLAYVWFCMFTLKYSTAICM